MPKWPGVSARQSEKSEYYHQQSHLQLLLQEQKAYLFTTSCFVQLRSSLEYQSYENGQDYVVSLYFLCFAANEQDKTAKWERSVYIIWNVPNNAH